MTRVAVTFWLLVGQVCLWFDWPAGALVALDRVSRLVGPDDPP